jgi:hypothetical protein
VSGPGRQLLLAHVTERAWRQQVLSWATARGWLAYFTWSSMHSVPGFPDLVLVREPRCIFAELKTERGKLTDAQAYWIERLRGCPQLEVYLWRPSDEEEVLARLF